MLIEIILDEEKFIEKAFRTGALPRNSRNTLFILAKHYLHNEKLNESETYEKLNEYMLLLHKNYVTVKWYKSLQSIVKRAKVAKKMTIKSINITEDEIGKIKNIEGALLQKLMFTLLALAKYYNAKYDDNKGWIKVDHSEIFRRANIQKNIEKQCDLLYKLYDKKLIDLAEEADNLNINVSDFINDKSLIVIHITDFRDLGYVYMQYLGRKYNTCKECGRLYKTNKKNKSKYCNEHKDYRPKKIKICECIDCKKMFKVDACNNSKTRCDNCNEKYRRERIKENVRSYRNSKLCNQVLE